MQSSKDILTFFLEFLKHPTKVGAILPTSQAATRMMVRHSDLEHAKTVAELGSGTGAMTTVIAPHIPEGAQFFLIEIDDAFIPTLRERFPNAVVHHGSVAALTDVLTTHGAKTCDRILSAIPWTSTSQQEQRELMQTVYDNLAPGGTFVTIAYAGLHLLPNGQAFHKLLKSIFPNVTKTPIVWTNIPPAFFYVCKK